MFEKGPLEPTATTNEELEYDLNYKTIAISKLNQAVVQGRGAKGEGLRRPPVA